MGCGWAHRRHPGGRDCHVSVRLSRPNCLGLFLLLCFTVLWALEPQRTGILWVLFVASLALLPFGTLRIAVGTLMIPLSALFSVLPIGIICLRSLVTRDVKIEDRDIAISVALLLFGNTLSLIVAKAPEVGAPLLAKWFFHSLLFAFLMSFRDRVWHVRTLLTLVLVTGGLSAYGLSGYIHGSSYDLNIYAGIGTRTATGQHLALVLPLAVGLGLVPALSTLARLSVWSSVGLSLVALLFTFNRAAWLGVLLGFFVLGASRRRTVALSLVGLCILVLGYVGPQEVVDRFWSIFSLEEDVRHRDITNALRLELQLRGLQEILEHPLLGVGLGNFALNVPGTVAYADKNPHDFYLTTWAEGGILAFVGLLGVLYFTIRRVVRSLRETTHPTGENLLRGGLGSLVSLCAQMFFLDDFNHILAWTILGVAVSSAHIWADHAAEVEHRGLQESQIAVRVRPHSHISEEHSIGAGGGGA